MSNPRPSRRLLVVEDSDDLRDSLMLLLELEGHQVRGAASAAAALQLCEQDAPEVALIDIGLPDMDGCDLARRLRDLPGLDNTRLVALTGFAGSEIEERCRLAGFHAHLLKPVDMEALQRVLS